MTTVTQIEAMKLALEATLEALRFSLHVGFDESSESQIKKADKAVQQHQKAITALREALAEQPQESPKFDPNESFAREEAAQARVREFMRSH